ncbi:MAG: hydrogenase 4 subunit F [Methanomassiliicoccales archaeon]
MIEPLLLAPLFTAVVLFFLRKRRNLELVSVLGSALTFLFCSWAAVDAYNAGALSNGIWYMDSLSAFMIAMISFVGLITSLYSVSYMRHEVETGEVASDRLRLYYTFLHLFMLTMLLVCVVDNLGIMWIAIEATTLASAFLVGFYEKPEALEAAWKYIIICSVGITLALLGTVLTYASSVNALGEISDALSFTTLRDNAALLDPTFLKIAFIFIMVGYGTKVGLAPMHTWLPDAHSQAPSPVSGLLSAVLLNCALYGILRFHIIVSIAVPGFSSTLLILFGLLSLATAAAFIIVSKDIKRMLAYSSIEHMGIIALGFGLGGFFGVFGALLQMLNHAIAKCLMFFTAGSVVQKYATKEMSQIRGLGTVMPVTALLLVGGALAITGSPPFGLFISEISILQAGLNTGQWLVSALYMGLVALIFAAFMFHIGRMVFGPPAEDVTPGEGHPWRNALLSLLLCGSLMLGLYLPSPLHDLLLKATALFPGVTL